MVRAETLIEIKKWYDDRKADLQSQPAIVKAIKADASIESKIRSLYFSLYNKNLGGCGSCLADALAILIHYSNKEMKKIIDCKFKLKPGVLLADSHLVLPHATAANLTDEIAIAYLKDNPARVSLFAELPDNWQELISDDKVIAEQEEAAQNQENAAQTVATKRSRSKNVK